jgi:hypothetical protein
MKITKREFYSALEIMSESKVYYPLKENEKEPIYACLIDWFDLDAQDAFDFNVLQEPKWHYYSDVRGMEMEYYIAELLKGPFRNALKRLGIEVEE